MPLGAFGVGQEDPADVGGAVGEPQQDLLLADVAAVELDDRLAEEDEPVRRQGILNPAVGLVLHVPSLQAG